MKKNYLLRIWLLCIAIIFTGLTVSAEKISDLSEVLKPDRFYVFKNRVYITEGTTIKIFDLSNGKFIKSFGKKGEGPGEFKHSPKLVGYKEHLIANSSGKVIFFTLNGRFLREIKVQGHNAQYLPVKNNFIGRRNSPQKKGGKFIQNIGIYDNKFKSLKVLYNAPMPGMMFFAQGQKNKPEYKIINNLIDYAANSGNIVIADSSKGFFLKTFNKDGKLIKEINKKYIKEKVSENYKKREMDKLKSKPWYKQLKDRFNFVFPEYFPPFKKFILAKDKIYIQTYKEKENTSEFILLDLKGKELARYYFPIGSNNESFYTIYNNNYIYLKENEDEENWELHFVEITKQL